MTFLLGASRLGLFTFEIPARIRWNWGSLFCLGHLCERRWLSSTPKLVTPLVTCSQRKVMRRLTRMLPFATSPKRIFYPYFRI
eukprot:UN00701